jgi:hypothetical protein
MSTIAVPHPSTERSALNRVVLAGATMAVLDILYAWLNWVVVQHVITTEQLFHSISAGLLGRDAANAGGMKTAVLGAFLHVVIAFLWTIGFYLAVRTVPALRRALSTTRGAVLVGLAFGAVVYFGMTYAVIPLSAAPRPMPKLTAQYFINLVQHMVMVGLPVALIIRDGEPR